tara:strand:- start:394 stop:849 length:456 start_codon:yes stop_codon:yes gene_type:complete
MVDLDDPILAGKIFHFAHIMSNSEHADDFKNVIDVVIALREKVSNLEAEVAQRPHQKEVDALRHKNKLLMAGAIKLKRQLEAEQEEREAAQRTIARLGGGIDEELKTFICANTKCLARAPMIRANQRYCSSRCKSAAGVRRHRAKSVGGAS